MAAPPTLTRITKEDVPDAPAWFETFLALLNPMLGDVTSSLDKGLTLGDNHASQMKTLRFRTGATVASAFPTYFTLEGSVKGRPVVTQTVGARNITTPTAIFAAKPWAQITPTGDGRMKVVNVTGLDVNTEYELDILIQAV